MGRVTQIRDLDTSSRGQRSEVRGRMSEVRGQRLAIAGNEEFIIQNSSCIMNGELLGCGSKQRVFIRLK